MINGRFKAGCQFKPMAAVIVGRQSERSEEDEVADERIDATTEAGTDGGAKR